MKSRQYLVIPASYKLLTDTFLLKKGIHWGAQIFFIRRPKLWNDVINKEEKGIQSYSFFQK